MTVFPQEKEWNTSGIIFFFVKDEVDQGEIDIVYSPADAPFPEDGMWANVLTKPKSGRLCWEDISVLVNFPVHYVDHGDFDEASDENKPEAFIFTKIGGSQIKVLNMPWLLARQHPESVSHPERSLLPAWVVAT